MDASSLIVGDIGGTNTRLGLVHRRADGWQLGSVEVTPTASDVAAVVEAYWRAQGSPALDGAAFCGAGPLRDGRIALTNTAARVDPQELSAALGVDAITVLNDFEAIAWCLPALSDADQMLVQPGRTIAAAPRLVIGPGTGFGAAALIQMEASLIVVSGEGGHARLPAWPEAERGFWQKLELQFGSLTIEKVLSGGGFSRLYQCLASTSLAPAEVAQAACQGNAMAQQAVDIFTRTLARVAADFALILGARGGVYIAGGMVPKWGDYFPAELFCSEFVNCSDMRALLLDTPVSIITAPYPALLGLAAAWQPLRTAPPGGSNPAPFA